MIEEAKTRYRCNQCEFSTYYQKGLQIHKRKMHQSYSCENCENIFETKRELKIHSYTHSFTDTRTKQICENCDFESNLIETMEVHIGKWRTKDVECGLCEAKFFELESLEVHLKTCEVYDCGLCLNREKNISYMKKHIKDYHKQEGSMRHTKMDRNNVCDISSRNYSLSDL